MKTGIIDLSKSLIIPKEGKFKANGQFLSIQLLSQNLGGASIDISLQGSLDSENWDNLTSNDEDISETLVSGIPLVRSFHVDPDIELRFLCASSTGDVAYKINA